MRLYKNVGAFFLLLYLATDIFAQVPSGYSYGLKAGLNFANFAGEESSNFQMATGFNIGGIVRYNYSENMFLQFEALLSEKGAMSSFTTDTTRIDVTWFLNYIEIPVLLGYDFLGGSAIGINPTIFAGPFIALKTSSKIRGDADDDSYNELTYQEAKSFDYGFVIGGSIEIPLNESRVILDFRYSKSLTDFDDPGEDVEPFKLHNSVITATIGYLFW